MDIRVLKYFLEVAKVGNITKAAERLNITQPTLSRQIRDLEEEVGARLFIRGKRQVTLTDAGFLYLRSVKEIIGLLDKAERDLATQSDAVAGVVSVGCVETNAAIFLADKIESFSKEYPLVRYELYNGYSDDIKGKLDSGIIDIGILIEPVEAAKYDYISLPIEENWGVLVNTQDPLADREFVTVKDIIDRPLIVTNRSIVKDAVESRLGVEIDRLNVFATHNLLTNTALLLEKNLAYMITVEGAYQIRPTKGLTFVPFSPSWVSGHVLAWRKNKSFHSAVRLFIEKIQKTL